MTKGEATRASGRLLVFISPSGAPGQSCAQGLTTSIGNHLTSGGASEGRSAVTSCPVEREM
eukprot:3566154-Alexandrium_andersonii.AAC.1